MSAGNIAKLLYSPDVIKQLKKELKSTTSINFEEEAVKEAVLNSLESTISTDLPKYKIPRQVKSGK